MINIQSFSDLHPMIVHFPIAFFLMYFVVEIVSNFIKSDVLNKMILILLISGVLSGIVAVLSGNQAKFESEKITKNHQMKVEYVESIELHEDYATAAVWYFTFIVALRIYLLIKKKFSKKMKIIYIALALIGALLIFQTASHGGELVYKFGIGTRLLE